MRTSCALLAVISLGFVFASCTPEDVIEQRASQSGHDSTYLSEIYEIDSVPGGIPYLGAVHLYGYDNLKRVTTLIDSAQSQTGWRIREERHFFYQGTDTLPYRSSEIFHSIDVSSYDAYYFYNAGGRRIRDSILIYDESGVSSTKLRRVSYSYSPGKMIDSSFDIAILNPQYVSLSNVHDSAVLDNNGNVVYNFRSVYYGVINTLNYQQESILNYDNHPNPFAHLSNYQCQDLIPADYFHFHQENNLLHIHNIAYRPGFPPTVYDLDYTGHYSYNTMNYPSQISPTFLPNSNSLFHKIIFVYRSP